ncbi:hypothetical protein R1CP_35785 (plasmid) [Rhodococcus opacus]|uniref:Uncharacterized protein n=1 Tax=Rhodococcus opacus TaxID=37919 RepID=A0A1B1KGK7_RHOOP|nr:hypothetical protein [Rhodococcus opacus]ANS31763.1 hypothetical protein R1CP_35785 [Rhodococcus opacus]
MEIEQELIGTSQHPDARDLSEYLVHMTRTPDDLASILTQGRIEARTAFGIGRRYPQVEDRHRAVCLTEMPVSELDRMTARGRSFGIAFKRSLLRDRFSAQPVWYLDKDSAPHTALQEAMTTLGAAKNWTHSFWDVTPYVDAVEDGRNAWRWEREWRVQSDIHFDLDEIALVIVLGGKSEDRGIFKEVDLGSPIYDPDGGFFWTPGTVNTFGASMELLIDRFRGKYETPDDAALPYDKESAHGYHPIVAIRETDEAIDSLYGDLPDQVRAALAEHLDRTSTLWCLTTDVTNMHMPGSDLRS